MNELMLFKKEPNLLRQADLENTSLNETRKVVEPTQGEIAKLAFELYHQSGCLPGRCLHNWLQAEQELQSERKVKSASPSKISELDLASGPASPSLVSVKTAEPSPATSKKRRQLAPVKS